MSMSFEEYLSELVADLVGHGMTELGAAAVVAGARDGIEADYRLGVAVECLAPGLFDPDDHVGSQCRTPIVVPRRRRRRALPLRKGLH